MQRRSDTRIFRQILRLLLGMVSLLDVGIGPGFYEQEDLAAVIVVEPSLQMILQHHRSDIVQVKPRRAEALPFRDDSFVETMPMPT